MSVTNSPTAVQLTQPATIVISEMEQAALNRMAQSIAQLTLCQVTGEEIATATKLLEKACQKLRSISEVPPSGSLTLTMQRGNLWKSAVHRSTVRSNASSKFLQNYAGRRVRQPRTPNTSAERKFTNLIKLKQYRVKKTVSPSTPTCWRQAPSFRSRRNTISHRETKHNKQTTKTNKQ